MTSATWCCALCGAAGDERAENCPICGAPRLISLTDHAGSRRHPPPVGACVLTAKDHCILEASLLRHAGHDRYLVHLARRKLAQACVVMTEDVEPDVATLNSRIAYSVDDGWPKETVIAPWTDDGGADGRLSIRTRRGLALLGLRAGASIAVARHDVSLERLTLHAVLYQPEQSRRAIRAAPRRPARPDPADRRDGPGDGPGDGLAGEVVPFPPPRIRPRGPMPPPVPPPEDTDPGPSAA